MERLSETLGMIHSRWLASSLSCCFPLQDQQEPEHSSKRPSTELTFTDRGKGLINIKKFASISPARSLPPYSIWRGFLRPPIPKDLLSGLLRLGISPHEHLNGQAQQQDEAQAVGQQLVPLQILDG